MAKFYVISPNVENDNSKTEDYLKEMFNNHSILMGYDTDSRWGQMFADMQSGDYVICAQGANWQKKCFFAGMVCGERQGEWPFSRNLKGFVDLRNEKVPFSTSNTYGASNQTTAIYELKKDNEADLVIISLIENKVNNTLKKEMILNCSNLLVANKNMILTGAPGTGKTYLAKEIAMNMGCDEDFIGFVQFHPSYDYTDFVEGLRPIKKGNTVGFERKDGVFKEFCKKALTLSAGSLFDKAYNNLIQSIESGKLTTIQLKTKPSAKLNVRGTDSIGWYSETEKGNKSSNVVSRDRLKNLYEVYNTLEKLDNLTNINEGIQSVIGGCDSTYYWGVLHHMLKQPFVFIIDEINRGEISKIFGELFYSIDPGYRGGKGKVDTQYQNLIPKEGDIDFEANNADAFRYGFYVPENVFIIGTMNDIDRSVESMDFAMRRRFAWKEISAKSRQSMLDEEDAWGENGKPEQVIIDKIKVKMDNLNACIIDEYKKELSTKDEIGLTKAYQIGAAYFLKYGLYESNQFENLWNNHLEGLLREYLRGTTDIEDKIQKLKAAYDDESKNQNEKPRNQEIDKD